MATTTKKAAAKAPAKKASAAKKAPAKKAAAPKATVTPMEETDPEFREPQRPTAAKLAEHDFAVVIMTWVPERKGTDPLRPADRDFEGCEQLSHAKVYFREFSKWAASDTKEYGDMWHVTVLLTNTKDLEVGDIKVASTDKEWETGMTEFIRNNPDAVLSKSRRDRVTKESTGKVTAKGAAAAKKSGTKAVKNPDLSESLTDEELANLTPEEVDKLPKGIKGKAIALRQKKRREDKAKAEAEAASTEAEAPKAPARRSRPKAAAKKAASEAPKAPVKRPASKKA